MFLEELSRRNARLIDYSLKLYDKAHITADTYVVDVQTFIDNAQAIRNSTEKDLYFNLQHIGSNPYLAKRLMKIGYQGCCAADFREAFTMIKNGVHVCNIGYPVQVPKNMIYYVLKSRPDYVTCYSHEKIIEIDNVIEDAKQYYPEPKPGEKPFPKQKIMLKVVGFNDIDVPFQEGGFRLEDLKDFPALDNVEIAGVISTPCHSDGKVTANFHTLREARDILENQGYKIDNICASADNCCATIPDLTFADSIEVSHALTGTHPLLNQQEIPCALYLSEVSHNYNDQSYVYGGGYHDMFNVKNALIDDKTVHVVCPPKDRINYYCKLSECFDVSSPVVMSFRPYAFNSRSNIALIDHGFLKGIYSPFGQKVKI